MGETEDFLNTVLPRLTEADTSFHNGDVEPRFGIWSHNDPVTLFGALLTGTGWKVIAPEFELLASRFSNCEAFEYEVIGAGASGNLAYVVGVEYTTASVGGAPPAAYELRVTTIFRREDGEWKAVHRHADPMPDSSSAREQLARFGDLPPDP